VTRHITKHVSTTHVQKKTYNYGYRHGNIHRYTQQHGHSTVSTRRTKSKHVKVVNIYNHFRKIGVRVVDRGIVYHKLCEYFLFILTYRIIMNTIPTSDVPNTHSYVNACHKYWKKHINVQVQCCDYCSSHHRIRHVFNNIIAREPLGKGIWTGFAAAGYNTTEGW
jgi:hypothetical protein